MPSPFPGMDPFLENPGIFGEVHDGLITYIRDALQPLLVPRYFAGFRRHVYISGPNRGIYQDALITKRPVVGAGPSTATATALMADPEIEIGVLPDEPRYELYVEIRQLVEGEPVVTVLEILSPSNKTPGPDRELYLQKVKETLASDVHLVEIDLLAEGECRLTPGQLAQLPPHRYRLLTSRVEDRLKYRAHGVRLDERLPRIRVPLRAPDPDVVLDLQAVFDRAYDAGHYGHLVRYARWLPQPGPLNLQEEEFARARIREAALA